MGRTVTSCVGAVPYFVRVHGGKWILRRSKTKKKRRCASCVRMKNVPWGWAWWSSPILCTAPPASDDEILTIVVARQRRSIALLFHHRDGAPGPGVGCAARNLLTIRMGCCAATCACTTRHPSLPCCFPWDLPTLCTKSRSGKRQTLANSMHVYLWHFFGPKKTRKGQNECPQNRSDTLL